MQEIWKEASVKGYYISNLGRLKGRTGKLLKFSKTSKKNQYVSVCVRLNGRNSPVKALKIHREVAKAFLVNPNNLPCVNHIDGNKLNNNVNNLEWCTASENSLHAVKIGLLNAPKGYKNKLSKLSKEKVKWIRKHYIPKDKNFGCRALSRQFGVSHSIISDIVTYKRY